jgi:hypothetical protein
VRQSSNTHCAQTEPCSIPFLPVKPIDSSLQRIAEPVDADNYRINSFPLSLEVVEYPSNQNRPRAIPINLDHQFCSRPSRRRISVSMGMRLMSMPSSRSAARASS